MGVSIRAAEQRPVRGMRRSGDGTAHSAGDVGVSIKAAEQRPVRGMRRSGDGTAHSAGAWEVIRL